MEKLCKKYRVIFDVKFFDIDSTMKRNIKACAEMGAYAITIANNPLNRPGILTAKKLGKQFGIKIIIGDVYLLEGE